MKATLIFSKLLILGSTQLSYLPLYVNLRINYQVGCLSNHHKIDHWRGFNCSECAYCYLRESKLKKFFFVFLHIPACLGLSNLNNSHAAAAAAKSLQSCLTLCDPRDGSPPGSPVPGILQARTLEWVAISLSNAWKWKVKVKVKSCPTPRDPMDCSLPGSSVHGICQARVLDWGAIPSPIRTRKISPYFYSVNVGL